MSWTQEEAIQLCRLLEALAPTFGCHVALTGGCLYKDGERKDCDILLYRIRQVSAIDTEGLFAALSLIGFEGIAGFGWVFKAKYKGKSVDLFFPEEVGGEYVPSENSEA